MYLRIQTCTFQMLINRERRQFVRWPKYVPTKVLLLAISAEYIHAWRGRIYTYKQTLHATHSRPVWGEKQSIIIVASTNTDGAATAFRWCAFAIARRVLCVTIRFAKSLSHTLHTHTHTRGLPRRATMWTYIFAWLRAEYDYMWARARSVTSYAYL